jgi:hypothetical protein
MNNNVRYRHAKGVKIIMNISMYTTKLFNNFNLHLNNNHNYHLLSYLQNNRSGHLSIFLNHWKYDNYILIGEENVLLSFNEIFENNFSICNTEHCQKLNNYLELWKDKKILVLTNGGLKLSINYFFYLDSPCFSFLNKIATATFLRFIPPSNPQQISFPQCKTIESSNEPNSIVKLFEQMYKPIYLLKDALAPYLEDKVDKKNPLEERLKIIPSQGKNLTNNDLNPVILNLPHEILLLIFSFCPLSTIKSLSLIHCFRPLVLDRKFSKHYKLNLEAQIAYQWAITVFQKKQVTLPHHLNNPTAYWFSDKLVVRSNKDLYIYEARFLEKKPIVIHFPYKIKEFQQLKKHAFMITFVDENNKTFMMIFHPRSKQNIQIFYFLKYSLLNSSQIALSTKKALKFINIRGRKITCSRLLSQKAGSISVIHTAAMTHNLFAGNFCKTAAFSLYNVKNKREIPILLPEKKKQVIAVPISLNENTFLVKKGEKIYQYDVQKGINAKKSKDYDLSEVFNERFKKKSTILKSTRPGSFFLNKKTEKAFLTMGQPLTLIQIDLNKRGMQAVVYGRPQNEDLTVRQKFTAGNISVFVGPLLLNFGNKTGSEYIHIWNVVGETPKYRGFIINKGARAMNLNKGKTMLAYTTGSENNGSQTLDVLDFLPRSELDIFQQSTERLEIWD